MSGRQASAMYASRSFELGAAVADPIRRRSDGVGGAGTGAHHGIRCWRRLPHISSPAVQAGPAVSHCNLLDCMARISGRGTRCCRPGCSPGLAPSCRPLDACDRCQAAEELLHRASAYVWDNAEEHRRFTSFPMHLPHQAFAQGYAVAPAAYRVADQDDPQLPPVLRPSRVSPAW